MKNKIKNSTKAVSIAVFICMIIGILAEPVGSLDYFSFGEPDRDAVNTPIGYSDTAYPEDAYKKDATWADNSPIQIEMPPAVIYDDSIGEEEYTYTPIAELMEGCIEKNPTSQEVPESVIIPEIWLEVFTAQGKKSKNDPDSELEIYLLFVDEELYGSKTDIMLRGYLQAGYSFNQAIIAYGISRVLEIDMGNLLPDLPNRENPQFISVDLSQSLSQTDKRNYELLAGDFGVRADALAGYAVQNDLSFREIERLALSASKYIYALSDPSGGNTRAGTVDEIIPEMNIGAPYSYDCNENETINLNDGKLIHEMVDYVLPGVNGLDLVIGRRYDSSNANIGVPYGESFVMQNYNPDPNAKPVITNYINSYTKPNAHFNNLYGLGNGWSFMFSSIQDGNVLYLADGRSFEIEGTATLKLKNYTLGDLNLVKESGAYNNGVVSSEYTLTYKNGKKEYFDSTGKLIGIRDRYNNAVKFINDSFNGYPRIIITDTLNRVITISCPSGLSNYHVMSVSLPNSVNLKYEISHWTTNGENYSALTKYEDPMTTGTHYSYAFASGDFNIMKKDFNNSIERWDFGLYFSDCVFYVGTNYFLNLTGITHPTGAISEYTYEPVATNLGTSGIQSVYRINSRKDTVCGTAYNYKTYAYSANNSSGYPAVGNPINLPSSFTYWTTVNTTESGLTEKHTFNHKHLTTSIESSYLTKKVSDKIYEYNADKLPTKISIKTYDYTNNSVYMESTELMDYDSNGNITALWSPLANGNTENTEYKTAYTYNAAYSQLTGVTYKQNAETTVTKTYMLDSTAKHPVSEIVKANGVQKEKTECMYDSYGNITSKKRYKDNMTDYILTEYGYQSNAYLSIVKANGVRDADGVNVNGTPGYGAGVVASEYVYDVLGRLVTAKDARGYTTEYAYNNKNDIIKEINPDGTMKQYARSYTTNYVIFTDEKGTQIKRSYTALGQPYEVTDILTNTVLSRKSYDPLCRMINESDLINESATEYAYDHLSRVSAAEAKKAGVILTQEIYGYSVTATEAKTTKTIVGDANSPSMKTTEYTDKAGRTAKEGYYIGGNEYTDDYTYDYVGNRLTEKTAQTKNAWNTYAYTNKWEYDYGNRVVREYDIYGKYSTTEYNTLGQAIKAKDRAANNAGSSAATNCEYDALGRLMKQSTPFEGLEVSTKKYYYDNNGNVTVEKASTNAIGAAAQWSVTEYIYNSRNMQTEANIYNGGSIGGKAVYTYDAVGDILMQRTGMDANSYETTMYTYDRFGNILTIKDAMNQIESYIYDLSGNILTKTDRNGTIFIYAYDGLGRLLTTKNNGTVLEQYTYTLTGNVYTANNANVTTTNSYDSLGRLTKAEEKNLGNNVITEKTYAYDIGSNRVSAIRRLGGTTESSTAYSYDEAERMKTVSESGVAQCTYSYDDNGNRSGMIYANGNTTDYTYNLANMVKTLVNKNSSNAVLSSDSYTYQLDGNQTQKISVVGGVSKTTNYVYDGLGRLTGESDTTGFSLAYVYDANSNRTQMTENTGKVTAYTYDKNNRLTKSTETLGSTVKTDNYCYDSNGNTLAKMVEVTEPAGGGSSSATVSETSAYVELYEYDLLNRMISSNTDGFIATYKYRPDGLCAETTKNVIMGSTDTVAYIYDGSQIVGEIVNGTVSATYLRGIGLIASKSGGTFTYYLLDGYNDVIQLVNSAGTVIKNYSYDAWGNEVNPSSSDTNPFRYKSYYFEEATGTYRLAFRYYNPKNGNYLTEDPARAGLNYYLYCEADPVNRIDPFGLDSWIIYGIFGDDEGNRKAAEMQAKLLEKEYGTPVYIYGVNSAEEFVDYWNGTVGFDVNGKAVTIDAVFVISHGHYTMVDDKAIGCIQFSESNLYAASFNGMGEKHRTVADLDPKKMSLLHTVACNTANLDFHRNIVSAFYNRMPDIRMIRGWDGGVTYVLNSRNPFFNTKVPHPVKRDRQYTFDALRSPKDKRKPGQVTIIRDYYYDGSVTIFTPGKQTTMNKYDLFRGSR